MPTDVPLINDHNPKTPTLSIDLNADVAEGCGQDERLMSIISSANICCGLHAGSVADIHKTLQFAKHHGVQVGAHPSLDDRANFGRVAQQLDADAYQALMSYQLGAMQAMCDLHGLKLSYVKPHGALYNQAASDEHLAEILVKQLKSFNPELALMGLAGSQMIDAAESLGVAVIREAFADRRYTDAGTLVSRSQPHAVIADENEVVQQVLSMVQAGHIITESGKTLTTQIDSICLHGDNEHAIAFASRIKQALQQHGIAIKPLAL